MIRFTKEGIEIDRKKLLTLLWVLVALALIGLIVVK